MQKIGRYSGNKRLDTDNFEEPDLDNERTKEKWLSGKREIKIKRKIRLWKEKISLSTDPEELIVHLVGQSHIDCAWMWRFEQTRKKAQVTFRKALFHAKLFPDDFSFALSEPLLLEWIKEDDPKLFKELQDTVKKGNIELVGGSYVEPDCMMPSGEAMVRQRLYGMKFYKENFNQLPSVEWFLDSFGYNYGLPQILTKSGAKYFWTSKLTWNMDTTFPFVNFWWQSPDGSKILTSHFHMDYHALETWQKFQIGRHLLNKDGRKIWDYTIDYNKLEDNVDETICPHVGYFFGLGDGGHGPTHKEVAYANEFAKLKWFQWSKVDAFFTELEKDSEKFPIWNDELYLETHRGCFSNHAEVKRNNRKYENTLISLEMLAVIVALRENRFKYPQEQLEKLWKILLKNQFHDVLPGSSIPEVYDECWDDWKTQDIIINDIISNLRKALENSKNNTEEKEFLDVMLFNPHTWENNFRIFIPISILNSEIKLNSRGKPNYAKLVLLNETKEEYLCQSIASEPKELGEQSPAGWWTVINLKPLSMTHAKLQILSEVENDAIDYQTESNTSNQLLTNDLVSIKLNPSNGAIIEIKAKNVNNGKNLIRGSFSNLSYGFLDDDKRFPAWNLSPEYWNYPKNYSNDENVSIQISESGPVFTTLEIKRMLGISPVTQRITLFKEHYEIFFDYITDWQEKNVLLKILYSTQTNAEDVIADGMYCAVKSKTNPQVPCDKSRYEKICHEYYDLSCPDKSWGLTLLNEGKYAYDVDKGDMRLIFLRSCRYPPPAPEAWVNKERAENEEEYGHKVPEFSGLGPFICRYALLPHIGGTLQNPDGTPNVMVKRKAKEFNKPIIVIPVSQREENDFLELSESIFEIINPNVYLGALKFKEWDNEKTVIIRFYEGSGLPTMAKILFNPKISQKITSINPVDLLEREIKFDFNWNQREDTLTFNLSKFEICTFEISFI